MPAKIRVMRQGQLVSEYEITKQSILIGRGGHCDLILDFPGVGKEMARLTAEREGFIIQDLSVLGLFIGGKRIVRQRVDPGLEVICGSVRLSLVEEPAEDGTAPSGDSSAPALWAAANLGSSRLVPEKSVAYLVSLREPADVHAVDRDEFVIGRNPPECQLLLDDPSVSKRHARIVRSGDRFVLADLSSTNGTQVNGQRTLQPATLKEGDVIRIGAREFLFQRERPAVDPQSSPAEPQEPVLTHRGTTATVPVLGLQQQGLASSRRRRSRRWLWILLLALLAALTVAALVWLSPDGIDLIPR